MNNDTGSQFNEIRYSRDVRPFGAIASALGVGISIGILLSASVPALYAGGPAALFLVAAAVAAGPLALCLAEMTGLGSREPGQNSSRFQSPDAVAFLRAWVLLGGLLVTAALLTRGCAVFLSALAIDLLGINVNPAWIAPILVLATIGNDIMGARMHRSLQNLLFIVLAVIMVTLAISSGVMGWKSDGLQMAAYGSPRAQGVALASGVFWGLFIILISANDIRYPARNGPRSTLIALPLIAGITAAGVVAAPYFGMLAAGNPDNLLLLIQGSMWEHLTPVVSLVVVAALLSALNRTITSTTFIASDMSRRGFLPAGWRRPHPTLYTPYRLLVGVGAVIAFGSTVLNSLHLLTVASLAFLAAAIAVNMPALFYRHQATSEGHSFTLPFAPLVPAVTIGVSLYLITTFDRPLLIAGSVWIIVGALVYIFYGRQSAAQAMEGITVIRSQTDQRAPADYRVLVPISNPATASSLLRTASRLAQGQAGEVIALHAVVVPQQTTLASGRRLARLRWQSLEQAVAQAETPAVPIHTLVRIVHDPVQGILDTVVEEECDLILLGWTGVSDRGSAVGPVIDQIVNLAACNVALLRGDPGDKCRHILVPTAGGPHAPAALRLAAQLAASMEGDVTLLTLVPDRLTDETSKMAQVHLDSTLDSAKVDFPVKTLMLPADDIQQALLDKAQDFDLILLGASHQGPFDQIVFGGLPETIARLSSTPVILVRRHRTLPQLWLHRFWLRLNTLLPTLTQPEVIDVYRNVRRDSRPDIDFFVLILLAGVIATFGLLQSSAAVIIGAMLVAPLMTPILGISMGLVRGDVRLLRLAAETALKGIFLAILVATSVVLLTPGASLTPEILARTHPTLLDLFVALASGAAGAYALGRKEVAAALPGVAIAAALVPPLCVGGIGIALSKADVTAGAMLLFCTNLIAITLAGAIVFFLLGLRPEAGEEDRQRRLWQGLIVTVLLVVAISIPLGWFLVSSVRDQRQQRDIRQVLTAAGETFDADLVDFSVDRTVKPSKLDIVATYYAADTPLAGMVSSTQDTLSQTTHTPVNLQMRVIPVSIVPGN